jgi:hypothetical protein
MKVCFFWGGGGCVTACHIKEGHTLRVSKNKVVKGVFRPTRNELVVRLIKLLKKKCNFMTANYSVVPDTLLMSLSSADVLVSGPPRKRVNRACSLVNPATHSQALPWLMRLSPD